MDDWIDVDSPAKRCRISKSPLSSSVGSVSGTNRGNGPSAGGSKPGNNESQQTPSKSRNPSPGKIPNKREDCRYNVTCFRRNETHLLQFRHRLLEDAFEEMEKVGDFTKLPPEFNLRDGDETVILEQANVLKNAGFSVLNLISDTVSKTTVEDISKATVAEKAANPPMANGSLGVTTSKRNPNEELAKLFAERKAKMQSRQELKTKVSERLNLNRIPVSSEEEDKDSQSSRHTRHCMAEKWTKSLPFNIFLTKVRDVPEEKPEVLSANFTDLFDKSLGDVKAVCHINFMVEATWFFNQSLEAGLTDKPTWLIYGDDNEELIEGAKAFPTLKIFRVKSPFPFGHHHTKMSFVQYTDLSVRFIVYTANLVESDWDNRTQGIWISPRCPRVPNGSAQTVGESVTNFRSDILQYLSTYPTQASAAWKDVIKYADCSEIKVYFVASAPITAQSMLNGFQFGIKKMEKVLRTYELETEPDWPLYAQCSSIGSLGTSAQDWVINEFGAAMSGKDRCLRGRFNLIYPTEQNVRDSFDGVLGGGCLPYSAMTHMKQKWLYRHLYQWKADCSGRSRAPPHIKSYSRWSPDGSKMAWILLTSANLSKAAWGRTNKQGNRLNLMSWEAGVLFIPELFGSAKYFTVTHSDSANPNSGALRFPLYYDVPLVKYGERDRPWFFETLQLAISE